MVQEGTEKEEPIPDAMQPLLKEFQNMLTDSLLVVLSTLRNNIARDISYPKIIPPQLTYLRDAADKTCVIEPSWEPHVKEIDQRKY